MQTSAEYRTICEMTYRSAKSALERALQDVRWTAALEQITVNKAMPPAVILDLDETVFDNSSFQGELIRERSPYSPQLWRRWVAQARASAIPGAADFLAHARQRHVRIYYVTNRTTDQVGATRVNLQRLGLPTGAEEAEIVAAPAEDAGPVSDKASRRAAIARTHRILLLIGDDLADFVEGSWAGPSDRVALAKQYAAYWGERWFLLPNPAYGSWETAFVLGKGDDAALAEKHRALKAME